MFFHILKMQVGGKDLGELVDDSVIDEMASESKEKTYKEGDIMMKQGEKSTAVYYIKQGTVNVFSKKHGSNPITHCSEGEYFGDRCILTSGVNKTTCIVASPKLSCYVLERDDFLKSFEKLKNNLPADYDIMQLVIPQNFKPQPKVVKLEYVCLLSIQLILLCY